MKKFLLFIAVVALLLTPLYAKKGIGFGATLTTGPMWIMATGGAVGTIADGVVMNLDLHLGADFHLSKKFRALLGVGLRPVFGKNGAVVEIYPVKARIVLGVFSVYAGLGFVAGNGGTAFATNLGIGFAINIGSHFAILLDLLDTSVYVESGATAILVNSLVGFNIYF